MTESSAETNDCHSDSAGKLVLLSSQREISCHTGVLFNESVGFVVDGGKLSFGYSHTPFNSAGPVNKDSLESAVLALDEILNWQ